MILLSEMSQRLCYNDLYTRLEVEVGSCKMGDFCCFLGPLTARLVNASSFNQSHIDICNRYTYLFG